MSEQPESPDLSSAAVAKAIAALTVTRSPEYRTIYSNVVRPRVGNGDITLIFSRLTHAPHILANAQIVEEQVEVVMSWIHLKMFEQTLRMLVDAIDQEVGDIPLPAGFKLDPEAQHAVVRTLGLGPPAKK
jgi:hypothetical protein